MLRLASWRRWRAWVWGSDADRMHRCLHDWSWLFFWFSLMTGASSSLLSSLFSLLIYGTIPSILLLLGYRTRSNRLYTQQRPGRHRTNTNELLFTSSSLAQVGVIALWNSSVPSLVTCATTRYNIITHPHLTMFFTSTHQAYPLDYRHQYAYSPIPDTRNPVLVFATSMMLESILISYESGLWQSSWIHWMEYTLPRKLNLPISDRSTCTTLKIRWQGQ